MLRKTKTVTATALITSSLFTFSSYGVSAEESTSVDLKEMNGEEIFQYYEEQGNEVFESSNAIVPFSEDPGGGGGSPAAPAPLDGHYLDKVEYSTKSISVQNKETTANTIATAVAAAGFGYISWTAGSVITALGLGSSIDTLMTGEMGAQFPIIIRQFVYFAEEPTMTYGGYAIIEVFNADNGEFVRSERIDIAKSGI